MRLPVLLAFFASRSTLLLAQDYSIPSQWVVSVQSFFAIHSGLEDREKNTTSSLSRDVRIQFAKQIFDSLGPSYDANSGQIPGPSNLSKSTAEYMARH